MSTQAIRSSKKRVDELTVYKFVKKELHLITNKDVINTLKILIEMGRIKNKPSKDKCPYFLCESSITDFEPHIPTIMATPLVETNSFTDILSPSIEGQINSFVSSDAENDSNNSLETLEVIDNACKYAKYKKIKDALLPEIKNDIRDFIQNEKLITNLERGIEFLESEISIKNEIIKKLLNNDIRQNKSCNMVGETWDFDVTHETSDSESTCSVSNSEDSIVESRDVNTVSTKSSGMSIDDQLKIIRKEKHQKCLLNNGCKSPSSENTKNNKNTKQLSDQQTKKENINEAAETNK